MTNVKIKVDPQETNGVKVNTTATAMTITAVGDISSGGDEEDKTNKLYYFKDLKNGADHSFPITQSDLDGFEYSKTLTAEINGVKYPAEYYYHPRGYIPYFSIYPNDEMMTKYEDLYVDINTHEGTIFNISLDSGGASFTFGDNTDFWSMETGITIPEFYADPMPILNISIYEEIADDDECCIIGIAYDTETNKWKIDGEDDPLDLINFIMGNYNKNGHPRSYYHGRVFYKVDFKNTENSPLDVIYLNAHKRYSERTDGDLTTTFTLRSTSNYVNINHEDSTLVLEIALTDTIDSTTYETTRTHSITVKVDGSQFPTV